jgi:hypothetical protein
LQIDERGNSANFCVLINGTFETGETSDTQPNDVNAKNKCQRRQPGIIYTKSLLRYTL